MRLPMMSRAAARLALQAEWDENAKEFAEGVEQLCDHSADGPPTSLKHSATDLYGDLDDCWPCDDDAGLNFTYGYLHAVADVARKLDVRIEMRFPTSVGRYPSDDEIVDDVSAALDRVGR